MDNGDAVTQDGTQAIRRAAEMLRCIARASDAGASTLREISETVGLSRSTAHRILKCLTDEGLVAYDSATRRYEIGMLSYELGLAVTDRALGMVPLTAAADRIALRANVTTYLMRRSGIEAVCVHKAEGRALIRAIPVEVGQRRLLGVGAGATALLAAMGDEAVERVLSSVEPQLHRYNDLTTESIRTAVTQANLDGFAESHGRAYASVYGLGMAVRSGTDIPSFALSIAVHAPEATPERIADWKAIIAEEAATALRDR
ncbi:IclR family transcriptional regulator [Pararhodobacter aggregans]|uniref:IclR family transcriptional regulator n=1 Tax=Pararhodobacter aggregans TaxID=404875 RepID=A0A2T7UUJ8_9RHOB|nr:IclR family transcriptional regulator [Pararhodobacter aggregans]